MKKSNPSKTEEATIRGKGDEDETKELRGKLKELRLSKACQTGARRENDAFRDGTNAGETRREVNKFRALLA